LGIYDAYALVSIGPNYQTFSGKIWRAVSLVECTSIILRMALLFQQRSVIRYYCLRGKTNTQIVTKLEQGYHQEAVHLRAVKKWKARFRAARETVKNDKRPGRPPQNNLGDAVLRFLEKQRHSSSHTITKALHSPRTTLLRVLDDIGLRFFTPRRIPHRLSDA
jgi:transposase